jgi:hypothetical protein
MARRLTLAQQAERLGIRPPTPPTLKRYGLTEDDWLELLAGQGWVCAVCLRRVVTWNTDHEHVARWKTLPPEERRRYVRGVLCIHCNYRKVPSRQDAAEAARVAAYLERYEARRDGA